MIVFRVILFFTTAFICTTGWWLVLIPIALWYSYQFYGYELIVLGALADIHFGANVVLPHLTLLFLAATLAGNWIKCWLMVYTTVTNV